MVVMRLWSLHPKYLDKQGLVALWREALLAQKVLAGKTKGYTKHPQLLRFAGAPDPKALINYYLVEVFKEAYRRDYEFDRSKVIMSDLPAALTITQGQLKYEWQHLLKKMKKRSPKAFALIKDVKRIEPHPIFKKVAGPVADWEKRQ